MPGDGQRYAWRVDLTAQLMEIALCRRELGSHGRQRRRIGKLANEALALKKALHCTQVTSAIAGQLVEARVATKGIDGAGREHEEETDRHTDNDDTGTGGHALLALC